MKLEPSDIEKAFTIEFDKSVTDRRLHQLCYDYFKFGWLGHQDSEKRLEAVLDENAKLRNIFERIQTAQSYVDLMETLKSSNNVPKSYETKMD